MENTIYVVEVLDKTDNWIPISSSMDEQRAKDTQKEWLDKKWPKDEIRISKSTFSFKGGNSNQW